jgi:hypothetical protein
MPSEESTCAVCDDSEGENSNAIVFCDGCNLAVHQGPYFLPFHISLWLKYFMQTVMASLTFLKVNGYAENALFHQNVQ